ncbi:MAG TPA: FixH family protein [Chitinophagaceae bacterium]|jgi:hypothetical protein|nr:FixH family protein [Chitinophagaceae bacterium]
MNWGNKLLIAFIVFISGISFLVYRSTQTNFEMVENDYYNQELAYQQKIDQRNQANQLSQQASVFQNNDGVVLKIPEDMKHKPLTGNVWFYCAYDKTKDRKYQLETDTSLSQLFTTGSILPGTYTLKLQWADEEKSYYTEKYLKVK